MSVLLLGLDDDLGPAIVRRLISEGDVVGVIDTDPNRGERWKSLGAHVAIGTPMDFDLVERASQHARSIVIVAAGLDDVESVIDPVLTGARLAPGENARIILVLEHASTKIEQTLAGSEFEYVVLVTGGRGGLLRRTKPASPDEVAEATNAADDLAGDLRLTLDLTEAQDRTRLGL